jgi:DNA-binding CsgD family transcriptional regulator
MNNMDTLPNFKKSVLTQAVLESFVDGILIMTEYKQLVYANAPARRICQQLNQHSKQADLPKPVLQVCQALVEGKEPDFDRTTVMESEVVVDRVTCYRIRARWLFPKNEHSYLMVMLEDRQLASQHLAIAEAKKYRLTARETEIWLLRRRNYTRKEIADQLHVTVDTVKKHLKNIFAKRQIVLDEIDWQNNHAKGA